MDSDSPSPFAPSLLRRAFLPTLLACALALTLAGCDGTAEQTDLAADSTDGGAPAAEDQALLRSLPYGQNVPIAADEPLKKGVVRYDVERTAAGWNLVVPRNRRRAFLVDNCGKVLHSWSARFSGDDRWQHGDIDQQGNLTVVIKDRFLVRLDWDSNIVWKLPGRWHHDVAPDAEGNLWALRRVAEVVDLPDSSGTLQKVPVWQEHLVRITKDGEVVREIPMLRHFAHVVEGERVDRMVQRVEKEGGLDKTLENLKTDTVFDVLHMNSVEYLGPAGQALGAPDDLLISAREVDHIAVIDPDEDKVLWDWGHGILQRQHHPTVTDQGTILVYDNRTYDERTRGVEIDPATHEIVWEYYGTEEDPFFSRSRGAAQRLPNGNTLLTESDAGRVFEVTAGGDIVWEFFSPITQTDEDGNLSRSALYRVLRYFPEQHPILAERVEAPARCEGELVEY